MKGSWPRYKWPDDAKQTLALLECLEPRARASRKACALERLARDLGYVRARIDGARRWISELQYLAMAERGEVQTYRFASERHAAARMKTAPQRRKEIAAMGAAARKGILQNKRETMQLNVQIVPFDSSIQRPGWTKLVQLPAREGQGEEQPCELCKGTGKYGRHEESCRKCAGTGRAKFVIALRAEPAENQIEELSNLLDSIPQNDHIRIQRTIRVEESGGGMTNTGFAQIVCGLQGEKLTGFGGQARCGAPHATFYVHAALIVTYSQRRGQGSGVIQFIGIDRNAKHQLGIEKVPLWHFEDGQEELEILSERATGFEFPSAAVSMAQAKARCYHCRSAYYASGGAQGPSGALTGAGAAFGGMPSPLKGPGIGY
jgi:hypothetical protein